jgi:drug/metabolite transporter (DMT)-like permease
MTTGKMLLYRYGFAFLILCLLSRKSPWSGVSGSPRLIVSSLAYAAAAVFYFYSLKYIPVGIATVVFFTYPLLVVLLSLILNQSSFSRLFYLALLITLAGIGLVSEQGLTAGAFSCAGLMLGLAGSLCYAIFTYSSERTLSSISPLQSVHFLTLTSFLVLGVVFFPEVPRLPDITGYQLLLCLLIACINTVFSIFLFLKGVEIIGPAKASLVSSLEPAVTILLAYLFLHEHLNTLQLLGVIMVLLGIFLSRYRKNAGNTQEPALPGS